MARNTAWAPTLAGGIWEGFQEEAPAWPSLRDERDWSFSHRQSLTGKAGEARAAPEAQGFPESGPGLAVGGRRGCSGQDGRASERGPRSQGHAEASEGFKQNRWVYFDAPLAGASKLDGLGTGSPVWRLSPLGSKWAQSV